jgi:hypothetical protein
MEHVEAEEEDLYEESYEDESSSSEKSYFQNQIRRKTMKLNTMRIIKEGVICDDLIFQIINESMRKIENMAIRLDQESKALRNLSLNLSS